MYKGSWKRRGLLALCLVIGLVAGFAAGYFIQKEIRKPKAASSSAEKTTPTSKSSGTKTTDASSTAPPQDQRSSATSAPRQPASSSTAPAATVPAAPLIYAPTPAKAMTEYCRSKGIDASNMQFSVVTASKIDPNWKLDKGLKAGASTYFLLHYVPGGWAVIESSAAFSPEQLTALGAPTDLISAAKK